MSVIPGEGEVFQVGLTRAVEVEGILVDRVGGVDGPDAILKDGCIGAGEGIDNDAVGDAGSEVEGKVTLGIGDRGLRYGIAAHVLMGGDGNSRDAGFTLLALPVAGDVAVMLNAAIEEGTVISDADGNGAQVMVDHAPKRVGGNRFITVVELPAKIHTRQVLVGRQVDLKGSDGCAIGSLRLRPPAIDGSSQPDGIFTGINADAVGAALQTVQVVIPGGVGDGQAERCTGAAIPGSDPNDDIGDAKFTRLADAIGDGAIGDGGAAGGHGGWYAAIMGYAALVTPDFADNAAGARFCFAALGGNPEGEGFRERLHLVGHERADPPVIAGAVAERVGNLEGLQGVRCFGVEDDVGKLWIGGDVNMVTGRYAGGAALPDQGGHQVVEGGAVEWLQQDGRGKRTGLAVFTDEETPDAGKGTVGVKGHGGDRPGVLRTSLQGGHLVAGLVAIHESTAGFHEEGTLLVGDAVFLRVAEVL
ncbi:MAG TPA: hypothetical protein VJZ78_00580 [Anaerolineales bacterium]|nr:hypothetical protein [Anaerolineales bacterium]